MAKTGRTIYLEVAGELEYALPAPPGRWLFVRQSITFQMAPGPEDSGEFPFAWPAGVIGGSTPVEQSGPQCSML
eukprot:905938-Prymnesium_polylepis.1